MRFKAFNLRNGIFIWFSYLMRANAKSSLKTCTGKIKVVTLQPNKKTQTNMSIKFDKRNYRKHNDANKRKIKKSLEECGAGRSVLVDADDCLIAGNGVYEQASALGIPTRVIETDGTELVVVKRTDLQTDNPKRKTLARYTKGVQIPVQFTAVWGTGWQGLSFSGFIDVYENRGGIAFMSEPQLWYNIGRHIKLSALHIGAEVELSYNFTTSGFMCNPCVGIKWVL